MAGPGTNIGVGEASLTFKQAMQQPLLPALHQPRAKPGPTPAYSHLQGLRQGVELCEVGDQEGPHPLTRIHQHGAHLRRGTGPGG